MKLSFKKGKFNLLISKILDYVATLDDDIEGLGVIGNVHHTEQITTSNVG